ncbi:MAG TPA: 23S rRNA (pseudouridine(1915)-N(3))-methyltransferase RlmH [Bryobacteraceae bacterium]|nr:23S rRNA (pseudouridine(1915)-N(3))-methyltransferase RlmH [Bryobacteraceae bacterium]
MKLFLYYIGRARDPSAKALAEEYIKRSGRYLNCEMREIKPERFNLIARHGQAKKVLLDPEGRLLDSAGFARFIESCQREARDCVFLVGGAEGLPDEWKPEADLLLSLSRMTFPHELARVMLAEQIYRALATLQGHPYPR